MTLLPLAHESAAELRTMHMHDPAGSSGVLCCVWQDELERLQLRESNKALREEMRAEADAAAAALEAARAEAAEAQAKLQARQLGRAERAPRSEAVQGA